MNDSLRTSKVFAHGLVDVRAVDREHHHRSVHDPLAAAAFDDDTVR
ncbi:MAG: hypothetical protein V9G15_03380 [Dermatophilaceae bacterium]